MSFLTFAFWVVWVVAVFAADNHAELKCKETSRIVALQHNAPVAWRDHVVEGLIEGKLRIIHA